MTPDTKLEEAEEKALAALNGPGPLIELTSKELAELQSNSDEESEDEVNPDLPERFIEIVQARTTGKEPTRIETIMTIQGSDDEEVAVPKTTKPKQYTIRVGPA